MACGPPNFIIAQTPSACTGSDSRTGHHKEAGHTHRVCPASLCCFFMNLNPDSFAMQNYPWHAVRPILLLRKRHPHARVLIPVRVTSGKLPLPIIGGVHRYDKLNTAVVWFGFIFDRFTKRNKSELFRKSKLVRICILLLNLRTDAV